VANWPRQRKSREPAPGCRAGGIWSEKRHHPSALSSAQRRPHCGHLKLV
jgi:hypothetical protein